MHRRNTMRREILAIAAVGSVFALTSAFATGISLTGGTTVAGSSSATVTVTSSTLCKDSFVIGYTLNNDAGTITAVTLHDSSGLISGACSGAKVDIKLNGTSRASGSADLPVTGDTTSDASFTLDTPFALTTALTSTVVEIGPAAY